MQPNSQEPQQQTVRVQVEVDAASRSRREALSAYVGLHCQNDCDGMMRMLDERFGCERREPAPSAATTKIMQCLQAAKAWKAVSNGMQVQQEWTVLLHDPMAKTKNQPVPFTITVCYTNKQHKQSPEAQVASPPPRMTGMRRSRPESTEHDRNVRQRVDDQADLDLSERCSHIDDDEIEMFLDEESIRLVEEQLLERDSEILDDQDLEDLLAEVLS